MNRLVADRWLLALAAAAALLIACPAGAQPAPAPELAPPPLDLEPPGDLEPPSDPGPPEPLDINNLDLDLDAPLDGGAGGASQALLAAGVGFGIASTPNMFGDLFNPTATTTITFQQPPTTITTRFTDGVTVGSFTLFNDLNDNGVFDFNDGNGNGVFDFGESSNEGIPVTAPPIPEPGDLVVIGFGGTPGSSVQDTLPAAPGLPATDFISQDDSAMITADFQGGDTTFALQPNTDLDGAAVNDATLALPPGTVVDTSGTTVATTGPDLDASTVAVENLQAQVVTSSPSTPGPGTIDDNGSTVIVQYEVTAQPLVDVVADTGPILVTVVNPGGAPGSVVGRQKLTENGSPFPRTRFFYNFSHFDNTPLTPTGQDVSRSVFGFELATPDQLFSFEFRAPFAGTLDSDVFTAGGGTLFGGTGVEFGNATAYFKSLLAASDRFALGAGLGLALPTADDFTLSDLAGSPLLVVENDSLHLLPYVGFAYSPNDAVFTQGFLQFDLDTSGNPTSVADPTTGVLTPIGRLEDANFVYADIAFGCWLYRDRSRRSGGVTGLAPVLELHYTGDTDLAEPLATAVASSSPASSFDLLNLTVGAHFEIGRDKTLDLAYATPIAGNDDQFDGEFRLVFNWYPGGTPGQPIF